MCEFSLRAAHGTPTIFSDDILTPFEDIGLGNWPDSRIRKYFAGKTVVDVGSGLEGIARRLYSIFGASALAPTVININPQFTDWRMIDERVNGVWASRRRYKQHDLEDGIRETMQLAGEDYAGYFSQRIAIAALAQQMPILDNSVDILISSWAVPTSFYDFGATDRDHIASYREISRLIGQKGVALLGPISKGQFEHVGAMLDRASEDGMGYVFKDTNSTCGHHRNYTIVMSRPGE
ncbi:MAG: hypothetical protein MUF85_03095 [Patescibacteria group bacterium]|nr:hypothetical protein [Patescibacteria group bacterium]